MKREYLTPAETAKYIRKALKASFPGVTFSVRSSSYSGGGSVDIYWRDGPTVREVDSVVGRYQGADFDGMIDLKTHRDPTVLAGENGELREVSWGADFVFTNRAYSESFVRWWLATEGPKFSWADPDLPLSIRESDRPAQRGRNYSGVTDDRWVESDRTHLSSLIYRELQDLRVTPAGRVERVPRYYDPDQEPAVIVGSLNQEA
jgi:hypothetical protein